MQVIQHIAQLDAPIHHQRLVLRPLALQQGAQRLPLHEIHDHEHTRIVVDQVNDARDRGMVQTRDHLRFHRQTAQHHVTPLRRAGVAHLFDRPPPVQ